MRSLSFMRAKSVKFLIKNVFLENIYFPTLKTGSSESNVSNSLKLARNLLVVANTSTKLGKLNIILI